MFNKEIFFPHLAPDQWRLVQAWLPNLAWNITTNQIDASAQISPLAVVEEGVIIGKNVVIRPFALIRAGSIVNDDCVIGHAAEIKNSYLGAGSKVQGQACVADSILGCGVRIGTGVVVANRRFDQKEIAWQLPQGEILPSGRDKLGALIGDYVRIGANAIVNPGATIGAFTWIAGLQNIKGHLGRGQFVKDNGEVVPNKMELILNSQDQHANR